MSSTGDDYRGGTGSTLGGTTGGYTGTGSGSVRGGASDDPRTLERRSDQIRADMNQTLDQLQRQYSPGALLDRGMDLMRDHGGDISANLGRSIRENPMPALLTLVGVGWMILSSQQRSQSAPSYQAYGDVDEGLGDAGTGSSAAYATGYGTGTADDGIGAAGYSSGTSTSSDSPGIKEKIGAKAHAAGDRLRGAKDSVAGSMHSGRERIAARGSQLADTARTQGARAQQGFGRMLEEQPLVVGAIGIALGAIIGALIPESERERQMLGEASQKARDKAMELGNQGYAAARETATKAAAAVDEATREDREKLKSKAGASGGASGGGTAGTSGSASGGLGGTTGGAGGKGGTTPKGGTGGSTLQ